VGRLHLVWMKMHVYHLIERSPVAVTLVPLLRYHTYAIILIFSRNAKGKYLPISLRETKILTCWYSDRDEFYELSSKQLKSLIFKTLDSLYR
jgi:hypothetical protein